MKFIILYLGAFVKYDDNLYCTYYMCKDIITYPEKGFIVEKEVLEEKNKKFL